MLDIDARVKTMHLRDALSNIHRDPAWWRKVLTGGALTLTIFGIPWSAGLVVESFDNIRKGFPTPLPQSGDPSTRYIIGLFAVLIDILFFLLLPFAVGLIIMCAVFGFAVSGGAMAAQLVLNIGGGALLVYEAAMFAFSISPVARLIYTEEGHAEDALGMQVVRAALHNERRRAFGQVRLQALPAYLPALLGGLSCWLVLRYAPAGAPATLALLLLLWLTASALLYAHLVVAQLYGSLVALRR